MNKTITKKQYRALEALVFWSANLSKALERDPGAVEDINRYKNNISYYFCILDSLNTPYTIQNIFYNYGNNWRLVMKSYISDFTKQHNITVIE